MPCRGEVKEYLVSAYPNISIGMYTAKTLLVYMCSVRWLVNCLDVQIFTIKCENLGKTSTLNYKGWWNISGRLFRVFKQFQQMLGVISASLPTWLLAVLEPIWPTDGEQRAWEPLGFSFHLVTQDLQSFWKSWAFSKWFFWKWSVLFWIWTKAISTVPRFSETGLMFSKP